MHLPDIFDLLPRKPTITVVDIGAMSLGEGSDPYQPLIAAGIADIVGFEPVPEEYAKLQAMSRPGRRYLPYAIGDGTVQPFHINNFPMTSSLLRPNHLLTDHFTGLSDVMQVVKTVEMKTHRLDDISEVRKTDFLKLDIQGAELQVLQHGRHMLNSTLVVQTEVEFVPLYQDQPLFADIDQFMRQQGFLLHRFAPMSGCPFKPSQRHANGAGFSQVLWSDAVYVRDFRNLDKLKPEDLLKLAILLHIQYHSFDFAFRCLDCYDRLMDTDLGPRYVRSFTAPAR